MLDKLQNNVFVIKYGDVVYEEYYQGQYDKDIKIYTFDTYGKAYYYMKNYIVPQYLPSIKKVKFNSTLHFRPVK